MPLIHSLLIAFSLYSRIPMPQFPWKEEDRKYMFCFFPWIGAVVGLVLWFWCSFCRAYHLGDFCRAAVAAAIPVLVTGGLHIDGFMDTMDALHSYRSRERKLEILKDSHIGAFAVIMLAVYGLLFTGFFSEIRSGRTLAIVCCSFFLSRCLCGISAVSFPLARKEGMLYDAVMHSGKGAVRGALYVQMVCCIGGMVLCSAKAGLYAALAAALSFAWYAYRSMKEFGGITGDTSGYFIVLCEGCMMIAAALGEAG